MRVDPDQAERLAALAHMRRRRRHAAGAQAVIAAERDRHGAIAERRKRCLIQLVADASDVLHIFLARIAGTFFFRDRRLHVAFVADGDAEAGNLLGDAGNPEGRRSHIGAPTITAQIQWDTDNMHCSRGLFHHLLPQALKPSSPQALSTSSYTSSRCLHDRETRWWSGPADG